MPSAVTRDSFIQDFRINKIYKICLHLFHKEGTERGGQPTRVEGTNLLRIDYPGFSGEETLEPISWDEFFGVFDKNNLVFLYQERTKDGGLSRFSKFVDRDSVEENHSLNKLVSLRFNAATMRLHS